MAESLPITSLIGAKLGGRYEILSELSQGGMGVVYKARDLRRKIPVAVKVLRTGQQPSVPGARRRFLNEARLLSKLKHPNIVSVFAFGVLDDGRHYLVMELLDGPLLSDLMQAGHMEPLRACWLALQLVRGMLTVHAQGIVHRDLKPQNVFLVSYEGQPDFVKIIDFGIAKNSSVLDAATKVVAAENLASADAPSLLTVASVDAAVAGRAASALAALADESYTSELAPTKPGTALGSPRYMSPEQIRGSEVDGRTDQYAIGCMLYQMLTGVVPFDGQTPLEVMIAHLSKPVPPLLERRPDLVIAESLNQLVLRMLAKSKEQRFPSLRDVEKALAREIELRQQASTLRALRPIKRRRFPMWSMAIGIPLLFLSAAAYLGATRFTRPRKAPILQSTEQVAVDARLRESQILSERSLRWARDSLGDAIAAHREAGVAVLSDCSSKEAMPLLASMLSDGDAQVRIAAARALSRRPHFEAQAISALRTGLRDTEQRVRLEALRALGHLALGRRKAKEPGADSELLAQATSWFAAVLREGSAQEQAVARTTLAALGDKAQQTPVRAFLNHPLDKVRQLLADTTEDDALLDALLADKALAVRFAAARTLLRLSPKISEAQVQRVAPILREVWMQNAGASATQMQADSLAAYALLSSLQQALDAADTMLNALVDKEAAPHRPGCVTDLEACQALLVAAAALPYKFALPFLYKAAADDDPQVRRLAVEALGVLLDAALHPAQMPPQIAIAVPDFGSVPNSPHARPLPIDFLRTLTIDPHPMVAARAAAVLSRRLLHEYEHDNSLTTSSPLKARAGLFSSKSAVLQ